MMTSPSWQAATLKARGVQGSVYSPDVVLRRLERLDEGPRRLGLRDLLSLTGRWREALISRSNDLPAHIRSLVSGHDRDGAPLAAPHLAFLPMANLDGPRADGSLLAMGLVLPEDLPAADRRLAVQAIDRVEHLAVGRLGVWRIDAAPPRAITAGRSQSWTAHPHGATQWATVTPVAFDRHPKSTDAAGHQREVAWMVAVACERIGLPDPREVIVTAVSLHAGVPPAREFPRLRRKDGSERQHAHAVLVFDEPVRGPMLLGAGRYRGYGVCRPLDGAARGGGQHRPTSDESLVNPFLQGQRRKSALG